ncbi:hypothetical protein N5F23_00260 [Pseudomonas sichuanensis]|uniref:hypothetical protein n=1 Tax=Pseudomonas sichuanensis TaxID=2213015 RepID=UPI002447FF46|nr:hypothetical protein [Pseudomonas sichuanensis]MDH0730999.1 hypothetical protein [Pseudomonas sichuanensis]MDH1581024.1 hypothetical protein [Pseudomonas sichuanensis]MDH1591115.1 hypothetical protein [Pseudomonas sichuanensis]MDH1596784.1 hypothetical protein [Pseudomonas sichuanensis]
MKRDVTKVLPPDHQAFSDAIEAMKRYQEAKDSGAPPEEVERLKTIAESLFQSLNDYQLRVLGGPDYRSH